MAQNGAEVRYRPVPDRFTVWGLFEAPSTMVIFAVRVPTSLGVNVTVIVQLDPVDKGLSDAQLSVSVKSLALVPPFVMLEMVYETLSLLVRTAVMAALVVPWFCGVKSRLLGDTLIGAMVGTTPAPELK